MRFEVVEEATRLVDRHAFDLGRRDALAPRCPHGTVQRFHVVAGIDVHERDHEAVVVLAAPPPDHDGVQHALVLVVERPVGRCGVGERRLTVQRQLLAPLGEKLSRIGMVEAGLITGIGDPCPGLVAAYRYLVDQEHAGRQRHRFEFDVGVPVLPARHLRGCLGAGADQVGHQIDRCAGTAGSQRDLTRKRRCDLGGGALFGRLEPSGVAEVVDDIARVGNRRTEVVGEPFELVDGQVVLVGKRDDLPVVECTDHGAGLFGVQRLGQVDAAEPSPHPVGIDERLGFDCVGERGSESSQCRFDRITHAGPPAFAGCRPTTPLTF